VLIGPDGARHRVPAGRRVTSNNQLAIRQLTLLGVGLSFHVAPEIAADLGEGRLVRVLPGWSSPTLSVDALMPARTRQPAKVRMALDALAKSLGRAEEEVRPMPAARERSAAGPRPRPAGR